MSNAITKIQNRIIAVIEIILLTLVSVVLFSSTTKPALVLEYWTSANTLMEIFYDIPAWSKEPNSTRLLALHQNGWKELRLNLPYGKISRLRLDPSTGEGAVFLRDVRITDGKNRVVKNIPLTTIHAANQIQSIKENRGQLEIEMASGANDPILDIDLQGDVDLRAGFITSYLVCIIKWAAIWSAILVLLYYAQRILPRGRIWGALLNKPSALIGIAAVLGTTLACAPVIFMGKSFVSPMNGDICLFYENKPTLPDSTFISAERIHGADTGAMMWQHFPLTVAQERALKKFGEFPLWNRFHSGGNTMIGQGQLMLGDPLNWLSWLVGVNSLTYDIKFLLLRILFAASLGLSVFVVTRAKAPSALVAFAAPFIGYFLYRVNHPAIFSLCYSPLILLAWLKIIYADEDRARLKWVVGLMVANWLVMNSGVAKEAYMAIIMLNGVGIVHSVVERERFYPRIKTWAMLLFAGGACFMMISSPVWGIFLKGMLKGATFYDNPTVVQQLPPWSFLIFADNVFNLARGGDDYFPAVNGLLFAGFTIGVAYALRMESQAAKRSALVLAAASGVLYALAYGLVPAKLILAIPFIKSILHVDNTFSTILIVPVSILAGIGFAHFDAEREKGDYKKAGLIVAAVFLFLIVLFFYKLAHVTATGAGQQVPVRQFAAYALIALPAAIIAPWLMLRMAKGLLSPAGIGALLIVISIVLGRGAMFPTNHDPIIVPLSQQLDFLVLNPQERVDLVSRPEIIDRLAKIIEIEPFRVTGLEAVLFPGYNDTLGLENITGPDAILNRNYEELIVALNMPRKWGWPINLEQQTLVTHKGALDLLGNGIILSETRIENLPGVRYIDTDGRVFAYFRETVWPRAFYTGRIASYDGVQALAAKITGSDGRPFVAAERRNLENNPALLRLAKGSEAGSYDIVRAHDYRLTNNSTSFTIDAPAAGIVYLGETDEPGDFIVTMNGKVVPYFRANHAFKAVYVEKPGSYRISFRYWPAHLSRYLAIAAAGFFVWLGIFLVFWNYFKKESKQVINGQS